jgi:pyridoxamine 5'-phosphate oxidase
MNPIDSILADRAQSRRLEDPNSDLCFLALADDAGNASVRTLVMRGITDNRVMLFINKTSPKWHIIQGGGSAQILLWYPSVQRQYRLNGNIEDVDRDTIDSNWQRRPLGSKYLDHVYETLGPQSSFVASRADLMNSVIALRDSTDADSLTTPPSATGVEMHCTSIEVLDLNNQDRVHDRQLFTLEGDSWSSRVMIP